MFDTKRKIKNTTVYINGVNKMHPGDILFVRWKSSDDNDSGKAKAMEVVDIILSEGVIPDGVVVCSVPRQFGMELMTVQDISNLIADLEHTKALAISAMAELSANKDMA